MYGLDGVNLKLNFSTLALLAFGVIQVFVMGGLSRAGCPVQDED